MTTRVKIVAVAAASAALIALGAFAVSLVRASDEDRGPIIVRGGSIKMENGEGDTAKNWKENGSKKSWHSDHSNGASAVSFAVTVSQATGPAAPSSPCPALSMTGTNVVIEYTTDAGAKSQVTVSLVTQGQKQLPQIDAPLELRDTPGSGTTPGQLVYDPGAGWISNVTITDSKGGQQLCGFVKAASTSGAELIRIKPNR